MPPTSTRPQLGPRRARGVEQGYHINKANKIVKNKGRRLGGTPPAGVGPGGAWPGATQPGPGSWPGGTWTSPTGTPTTTPTMTEPVGPYAFAPNQAYISALPNAPFQGISERQQAKLGKLQERREAGKNYNEERLRNLLGLQRQTNQFVKYQEKFPERFAELFGGPGQEAAGTSVSNWYGGLTPEQQQQVAALAYANRGNVGPYAQGPTGGPLTMGNLLREAFPGLRGAYLEGIYGLGPNTWLGMSPQEQYMVRRENRSRPLSSMNNPSLMNLPLG